MVLLQYCNLLLHKAVERPWQMDIIGEDKTQSTQDNDVLPADDTELAEYAQHFAGVTTLICQHKGLTALPSPRSGFFDVLEVIDLSQCSYMSRLPSGFGSKNTVRTLNVSGTKLSAIPLTFMPSLRSLDVSHCRRMTNVGETSQLKVLNITASAIVDIAQSTATTIEQLIALNSKVSHVSGAAELRVVIWSGPVSTSLLIEGCDRIMTVVTTGSTDLIRCDGTPYITTLHL